MKAVCYSIECTGKINGGKCEKPEALPSLRDCPDCGHALVWKTTSGAQIKRATKIGYKARVELMAVPR